MARQECNATLVATYRIHQSQNSYELFKMIRCKNRSGKACFHSSQRYTGIWFHSVFLWFCMKKPFSVDLHACLSTSLFASHIRFTRERSKLLSWNLVRTWALYIRRVTSFCAGSFAYMWKEDVTFPLTEYGQVGSMRVRLFVCLFVRHRRKWGGAVNEGSPLVLLEAVIKGRSAGVWKRREYEEHSKIPLNGKHHTGKSDENSTIINKVIVGPHCSFSVK